MFHQVFICNPAQGPIPPEDFNREEVESLLQEDVKPSCIKEEISIEDVLCIEKVENEEMEKAVINDLVGQIKIEDESKHLVGEEVASMTCLSREDTKVFKENSVNEENKEATTLFNEETQNTDGNNYLGLCTDIPSTVVHNKYEKPSNELDSVDYTNSETVNSSKKNEQFETSVPSSIFQVIIADDSGKEYITSDPNPISSPFGKTKSTDTKLDLPPIKELVSFSSNISNGTKSEARLKEESFSEVNAKFPNSPQPIKITEKLGHVTEDVRFEALPLNATSRVEKEFNSRVSKGKRPHRVAHTETEASLNSVHNKEGRSRSSLVDSDDSGSDWEQEYLASKNVCSKPVNKRSTQAKQDHTAPSGSCCNDLQTKDLSKVNLQLIEKRSSLEKAKDVDMKNLDESIVVPRLNQSENLSIQELSPSVIQSLKCEENPNLSYIQSCSHINQLNEANRYSLCKIPNLGSTKTSRSRTSQLSDLVLTTEEVNNSNKRCVTCQSSAHEILCCSKKTTAKGAGCKTPKLDKQNGHLSMERVKQSSSMDGTNSFDSSTFKSADRASNVVCEKQLISQASFSNKKVKALMPTIYEKDPKTGLYLVSKQNGNTCILSQLLFKNNNNGNSLLNQNKKPVENHYDWKYLPQKLFVCPVCQKIFQSSSSFDRHKNTICLGQEKLDSHKNTHTNAKPYKCEDCDEWFNSIISRNFHHKDVHLKINEIQRHDLTELNLQLIKKTSPSDESNDINMKQSVESCIVPKLVQIENLSNKDQSENVGQSVKVVHKTNVNNNQPNCDQNPLNETNLTSHCEISNIVTSKPSRDQSSELSCFVLKTENVNNSTSIDIDIPNHKLNVTLNEDKQNCYLNQSINKAELKTLQIILHDCMKATKDTMEVKQPINMDGSYSSISLRKRPYAPAFEYRGDSDSSSNVSFGEESFSDWEVDYLKANDTSSGFKSLKKASSEQTDCSISSDSMSYQESIEPSIILKSADPSDIRETSCKKPVLNNTETFTPYSVMCSDCGVLFVSEVSFRQHEKDSLCVKLDDRTTQNLGCKASNDTEIPTKKSKSKIDEKITNLTGEKNLISEKTNSKALTSSTYEKDPNAGIHLVSKTNEDVSIVSQLLNKNKSSLANQNVKTREHEYKRKDLPTKLFVCLKCEKIFYSPSSFYDHKNNLCLGKTKVLKFQCDICGKLFPCKIKLDNHRNTHTNAKPHKCEDCDKWFNSLGARSSHHKKVHIKKFMDLKYLCCFCGMTTPSIEHMTAHEEFHRLPEGASVPTPFKCLRCPKRFISNFKLKAHLREHGSFKCDKCKKKFLSIESLEKHKLSHKDNEEFKCNICSKTFSRRSNMYFHKRNAHVRTLQFFCDICDKGFKQKHHIEQHMISHSEERPISCPECDETFKRKTHLKQHVASFHNKSKKQKT